MTVAGVAPTFREIPIALIDEPTLPSRTSMDETLMDELVASIRAIGFISTIDVVQKGERFEVIAGHRRRLAAARAGLVALPCLVYPSAAGFLEAIQQAENRHREPLSAADEAIWFQQLFEAHPEEGTDGVAARVGETRAYVEGRLALFQGDERVFEALQAGKITIGIAHQLNRVTQAEFRRSFLDDAIRNGATVALVRDWVERWKTTIEPATRDVFNNTAAPVASAPAIDPYFTCRACDSTEHPEHMRPFQLHEYCQQAIVKPALEFWRRKSDYIQMPRTEAEALALIDALLDRFPSIGKDQAHAG